MTYTLASLFITEESGQQLKQGWNLEAGADAEAAEDAAYGLAYCDLLGLSSYKTQDQ